MHPRSAAAEFPNDNPELHAGAIWRADSPCAPLEAIAPEPRRSEVVALEPVRPDDFARLVAAMVQAALAVGETRAAALVAELGSADRIPEAIAPFAASLEAWRAVLGGSGDIAACGDLALDEWAALILTTLLGAPARAAELRRALRARGVAAFGLIAQAA